MKRGRKILLWTVIVLATVELSPYMLSPLMGNGAFSRAAVRADLLSSGDPALTYDTASAPQEEYLADNILHPYLGFVSVPLNDRNRFGLPGADPLLPPSPDTVRVCLMGGSVAMGVHTFSQPRLIENLHADPRFRGKAFTVSVFALGGFKQPQPLEALSWFRSMGARYDLIITLDGFNDIVLPWCDNAPYGVHPSYPRNWNLYARKKLDLRVQRLLAQRLAVEMDRESDRSRFASWPLRVSNAALLLWNTLDRKHAGRLAAIEQELRTAVAGAAMDLQATGPAQPLTDTLAYFTEQADLWMRCQRLIAEQAAAMGALSVHFLQPNQYVPGSKHFTEEEERVAIEQGPFCYREAVERGYPLLAQRVVLLRAQGVRAFDLTAMFEHEPKAVYADKCCHFNQLGWDLIADAMAGHILEAMPNTPVGSGE